jgi:flavin reductase (DIM6/NTAB) family NADH-FMN oxidoreductase RutF
VVGFASEGHKDSVANVEATGEFVCNLVGMELAEAMNATSATVAHGVDEMKLAGLEAAPCTVVKAPRVARAAAALECRLLQVIRLAGLDGVARDNWVVLGEVVGVHIAGRFLVDGRFDTASARPVARCGYRADYTVVTELFEMQRPG